MDISWRRFMPVCLFIVMMGLLATMCFSAMSSGYAGDTIHCEHVLCLR